MSSTTPRATAIEKYFNLNREDVGFDSTFSMETAKEGHPGGGPALESQSLGSVSNETSEAENKALQDIRSLNALREMKEKSIEPRVRQFHSALN
jgi:hypothetical protein